MSEKKYEDLYDLVLDTTGPSSADHRFAVKWTLECLDEFAEKYPGRMPGPTITESQYEAWLSDASPAYRRGFMHALTALDVPVVPDPPKSNAEKLGELLVEFAHLNASCGGEQGDHELSEFLSARGVKADGDDE